MSNYHSDIYDDENNHLKREERFRELTKNVIRIVHPLLNPVITSPQQAFIDYHTHPQFQCTCRAIVEFIMKEKPNAEEHLKQAIEIDDILRNVNLFMDGK